REPPGGVQDDSQALPEARDPTGCRQASGAGRVRKGVPGMEAPYAIPA
ncbi:MAG: hypothetical protein RIS86_180, partial [Planctomycetota bacterium]